jgi:hypothetical protein
LKGEEIINARITKEMYFGDGSLIVCQMNRKEMMDICWNLEGLEGFEKWTCCLQNVHQFRAREDITEVLFKFYLWLTQDSARGLDRFSSPYLHAPGPMIIYFLGQGKLGWTNPNAKTTGQLATKLQTPDTDRRPKNGKTKVQERAVLHSIFSGFDLEAEAHCSMETICNIDVEPGDSRMPPVQSSEHSKLRANPAPIFRSLKYVTLARFSFVSQ